VRNRLERWEIDDVAEAVIAADAVLERRTELEAIEQSVGVDETDGADVEYASAPMQPTGGVDFTEVTATLDEAIALGEQLTGQLQEITAVAPQAGVSPPELSDIEGVADFASGIAATDGQLDAMARIIELDDELDAASGIFVTIGRWGSDIEGDLDAARSQVERGDSDAALAILGSAEVRIDDLAGAGRVRVLIAGALVVVVIVVFVGIVLVTRSRRAVRRQAPAELRQR
jgi:hypothetical protein